MKNARQLQYKPLRGLEKISRRKNNGKQWKKQCAEQWKLSDIRPVLTHRLEHIPLLRNRDVPWIHELARVLVGEPVSTSPDTRRHIDTPQKQSPAAERRRAHTSETRISAIAHPSAERHQKALLLSWDYQRSPQYSLIRD
jgi:hypothetical protein